MITEGKHKGLKDEYGPNSLQIVSYFSDSDKHAALYEQLAEECVELAHEAQKYARYLRGDNPIGESQDDIRAKAMKTIDKIKEEYSDLWLIADTIGLEYEPDIVMMKQVRWLKRLERWYNS